MYADMQIGYADRAIIEYNFRIEDEKVDDVFTHFFAEKNTGRRLASPSRYPRARS